MATRVDPALIPPSPDLRLERALWKAGGTAIAGIDEAGRGALAGPVCAAAVVLPRQKGLQRTLRGVRDSKEMTPLQRDQWAAEIKGTALAWATGFASESEIDAIGIVPATRWAAQRALESLPTPVDHVLIDALYLPDTPIPQTSLLKGDARCLSIAAASVLAKVARDEFMVNLQSLYPRYNFAAHKGYGTAKHRAAIAAWGPSAVHRRSFALLPSS